jgi:hypothetical protein
MHYDPIPGTTGGGRGGGGGANGAVPHRTYPAVNSPWVAPGTYAVRLTVNGKSMTQPITVKMDPRVKITPEVQQIFTLSTRMERNARNADAAYEQARAILSDGKIGEALRAQIEEIAPERRPESGRGGGRGGFGPPEPPPTPTLANIGGLMVGAVMPMQASEMAPTATELAAAHREEAAYTTVMAKWMALKARATGAPKTIAKK